MSTGSNDSTSEASKVESSSSPTYSIEHFKSLSINDKLESIFLGLQDVRSTNTRLLQAEQTVREIHESTRVNTDRINILAYKSIDIEARQRRNNLIFWGIPEGINEDPMTVLAEFMSDKLGLDPDAICIQRAHRVGKLNRSRNRSATITHRPLIAAFRDYQDVELVISNAGKLKGSAFGINRDYPQEIVNARKVLYREKKLLKSQNPSANISIQYPAKLVVNGRTEQDMFPEWFTLMRRSRLADNTQSRVRIVDSSMSEQVFDSSVRLVSDESDMEQSSQFETEVTVHRDPPPRNSSSSMVRTNGAGHSPTIDERNTVERGAAQRTESTARSQPKSTDSV
ncbi:MAG: hypothetical protein AB2693_21320 [Candidatus Thiodiazotropha sp.]